MFPLAASLQVFQTSSEKIESAGLAALTALTSCLSRSVLNSDSEDSLCTFLDLVLKGETLDMKNQSVKTGQRRGMRQS